MRFFFFVADPCLATVSIVLTLTSPHSPKATLFAHQCRVRSFLLLGDRMSWHCYDLTFASKSELEVCLYSAWNGQWCTLVSDLTSSHPCLSVSTVSFYISLPLHCLHTHHTSGTGTWQRTWEDVFGIFMVLGMYEASFFSVFFLTCCEAPSRL